VPYLFGLPVIKFSGALIRLRYPIHFCSTFFLTLETFGGKARGYW
jgi:hypothetical protein